MNYQNKNILIIGAGELQIPLIRAAKNLGLFVIATDKNPKATGFKFSDDQIIACTMNYKENSKKVNTYLKKKKITLDGVTTSGTDASYTVAYIAKKFSLPGHTKKSALNATNKAFMRDIFKKNKIPIPEYKKISSLREAEIFFKNIGKACVLKPLTNMGARGISLIKNIDDLEYAFHLAEKYNTNHLEYIIEEFIDAKELSLDALIFNNNITITGIADRIIEYSPYFVETGHILPSNLPEEWIERAVSTFKEGIKALGLSHGAAKCDLKISENQTWIIEIAARLSGGFMSSHTFPYATGIPLHEHMIRLALGEDLPEIKPVKNSVSVERAIIPPEGLITEINIPDDILDYEHIMHLSIRSKIGDYFPEPKNNLDKVGNIIATAANREEALRSVNKAIKKIKIITKKSIDRSIILKKSNEKAKMLLKGCCNVCRYCDGLWCRGLIPGVGGVGTGEGFTQAYDRFREIKILPSYIHNVRAVDTSIEMFGENLSMPVFTAPISGSGINYNNATTELEFQRSFVKGAFQAGTMAFTPDPGPVDSFGYITEAILENYGHSIPICKPRDNLENIKNRYSQAISAGAIGIGTDIDGIGIKTLTDIGQKTSPKSIQELKELIKFANIPFVVKGILSVSDAKNALDAGATHLIVSSHGGRISEGFPLPIDILSKIRSISGISVPILIDGAIRSGADIIKCLILGADAVLIGRPVAIHAIGARHIGVKTYLEKIQQEIELQMLLLGVSSLQELKEQPELLIDLSKKE